MCDTTLDLVIDCDPGHDDAIALMVAHRHANVLGITTVSGNAPLADTSRNALALTELAGWSTPVHSGAAAPLNGKPLHATHVHGETGLGGAGLPEPASDLAGRDAPGFLLQASREVKNLWVVAIGPLTNLALALREDPDFAGRVAGISIMGGSATAGNVTRAAEFNIWADPEAAAAVFRSGARLKMCGLNLTTRLQSEDALIRRLAGRGPVPDLVARLFAFIHGRMEELAGERRAALHDPCAVLALTHPHLIRFEPRAVDVELAGEWTRGMTVVDERTLRRRDPPNADVAYGIDAGAAMEAVLESVLGC